MEPLEPKDKHGPEYHIQDTWVDFLRAKKWRVERMHGNAFQKGIPDVYIAHLKHGKRWIDFKVYGEYNFTKAQKIKWPIWEKYNIGIWILGAESKEACTKEHMISEYTKLFEPPNWRQFWKESWEVNIDELLDQCDD